MADRDASELGRCPECLVLEGRHAHDCVTGDKAFEAYEDARQHPTTPTPEPVAERALAALNDFVAKRTQILSGTHAGIELVRAYIVQAQAEIADLRGKLERAEREHRDALNYALDVVGEREAATSRATEAERLLRELTAIDSDRFHEMKCSSGVGKHECAPCKHRAADLAARKHLRPRTPRRMTAMDAAEQGVRLKSTRENLYLHLSGGSSTPTVYLSLCGTKTSGRIYLGVYDHKSGSYRGSVDGKRLLRWLESGAKRVRAQMEHAERSRIERAAKRKGAR